MTDKTKNNILFPDNTVEEMYLILKQNGLERPNNDTFYGAILGRLMKWVAVEKISFEQFIEGLSQEIQIDKEKAQQIAKEARTRILDHINNPETQPEKRESLEVKEEIATPEQERTGPDDYREPVE